MFSKQKHSPSPQLKIGHKDEESLLLKWGGRGMGERRGLEGRGGPSGKSPSRGFLPIVNNFSKNVGGVLN